MARMFVCGLLLVCALPVGAKGEEAKGNPASPPLGVNAAERGDEAERPFIERSLVLAPEQIGKFVLNDAHDYPGNPGSGVGLRYQHPDFPQARVDIFVYPAGRMDRDEAVAGGIAEVRGALQAAEEQGSYTDVEMGEDIAFDLLRVDEDGSLLTERPAPVPSPVRQADAAKPELEVLLAAIHDAEAKVDPAMGRLLDIRLTRGGEPMNSRAFLFYRGLYLVKGRISASPRELPGEAFERFTNHAMATLVPAIVVRNTGGCHQRTLFVDPDSPSFGSDLAAKAAAMSVSGKLEGCSESLDETVPQGFRGTPLVFDPDIWRKR